MIERRLELIAPDLLAHFRKAPNSQLRAVALAASRFALEHTGLADPLLNEGLEALESARYGDTSLRERVESFIDMLDQIQWNLQDLMDEGKADQTSYLIAFRRARAAHSVYFALDLDAFAAAAESVYEANAATEDFESLNKIILSALNQG